MKYRDIVKEIEKIAPPELAESWDNSGTQIYTGCEDITDVLVCLEITDDVITEATESGAQLIISHHPLIFGGINRVDVDADGRDAVTGRYITRLIENGISAYSAHTSFDSAPEGNNYYLAKLLGLENIEGPSDELVGSIGFLSSPLSLDMAAELISERLDMPRERLRIAGAFDDKISKMAICTGAGGIFLEDAVSLGCDLLITGDVKFDQAQYARGAGISLIDAGHFDTEKIFVENFAAQLRELAPEIHVKESTVNTDPFVL